MKPIFVLSLVTICLIGCQKNTDRVTHGVYIWNTRSSYNFLDTTEIRFLRKNRIEKLYCKLTDVVWNDLDHAYPTDTKEMPSEQTLISMYDIVPCIFITNEVMLKSTPQELSYMAEKISARLLRYKIQFNEYQIDCDWSEQSKGNYFHFLNKMKEHLKTMQQSITLRLYPYKYFDKLGVPPADRAMLMLYNFKSPQALVEGNTIFDKAEAEKYITHKKYPLPLDFALPSFSWGLLYDSDRKFLGFIHEKELATNNGICNPLKYNLFQVHKDTVIKGVYLRQGNLIKQENIHYKEIQEAHSLIEDFKNTEAYSVSIFDLNSKTMAELNTAKNENVFTKPNP